VCCLLLVGGIYLGLSVGLNLLARWAERSFEAYPYLAGEEPIRLLLPTVHGGSDRGALLLGPSAIGEAFLYEELERQWGMRVRSGSISGGTIDDCYLFLSYIEQVYGPQALPSRLVLGITPRVIANLPRLFGSKLNPEATPFLIDLVNRYSTHYRVERGELGTELVAKGTPERVLAWLRFYFTKQQPRHRTAVLAAIEHAVDPDPLKLGFQRQLPDFTDNLRLPLTRWNTSTTAAFALESGPWSAGLAWARAYRSAYTNMFMERFDDERIERIVDGAEFALDWDPRDEEAMVAMQLSRFASIIERNGIELVVVHLPAHSAMYSQYSSEEFAVYQKTLDGFFPNARYVNLWNTIPDELFFDEVHLKYEGARRATQKLIAALEHPVK
jgi:hypothetical protein